MGNLISSNFLFIIIYFNFFKIEFLTKNLIYDQENLNQQNGMKNSIDVKLNNFNNFYMNNI